ncbi:MAG: hypothetical protein ACTSRI_13525 [Promethearchaeota archaeon]
MRNDQIDLDLTKNIVNKFDHLKIDQLVEDTSDLLTPDHPVEAQHLIAIVKHSLEIVLRIAVSLGSWTSEKSTKIREIADKTLYNDVSNELDSIEMRCIDELTVNEREFVENLFSINSNLVKIQYLLMKWLSYLHVKYGAEISSILEFILKP